jgi:hypothetical protein
MHPAGNFQLEKVNDSSSSLHKPYAEYNIDMFSVTNGSDSSSLHEPYAEYNRH